MLRPSVLELTAGEYFATMRIGRGDFLLGVRTIVGVTRTVPLVKASEQRNAPIMISSGPRTEYIETIEAADAALLVQLGQKVGPGLGIALDIAWPHLPSRYREDLLDQFSDAAHLSQAPSIGLMAGSKYAPLAGYQSRIDSFNRKERTVKHFAWAPEDED